MTFVSSQYGEVFAWVIGISNKKVSAEAETLLENYIERHEVPLEL